MEANVPYVNTIPGRNVFYMDCRILPQYSVDKILDACKETAAEIGSEPGLHIQVDTVYLDT